MGFLPAICGVDSTGLDPGRLEPAWDAPGHDMGLSPIPRYWGPPQVPNWTRETRIIYRAGIRRHSATP